MHMQHSSKTNLASLLCKVLSSCCSKAGKLLWEIKDGLLSRRQPCTCSIQASHTWRARCAGCCPAAAAALHPSRPHAAVHACHREDSHAGLLATVSTQRPIHGQSGKPCICVGNRHTLQRAVHT